MTSPTTCDILVVARCDLPPARFTPLWGGRLRVWRDDRAMRRYEISEKRRKKFDQRPGEDVHGWIARQLSMARPYEVA